MWEILSPSGMYLLKTVFICFISFFKSWAVLFITSGRLLNFLLPSKNSNTSSAYLFIKEGEVPLPLYNTWKLLAKS